VNEQEWLRTGIGHSTAEAITVRGRDLAGDLMGRVSFTELAFLLASGRMPSAGETRLFDAVLVSLADHGLTPTVLAARLTYTGAPEAIQGAIAAGLLGGGTVFLGVVEDTARYLDGILGDVGGADAGDEARAAAAEQAVRQALAAGRRIPGLGHPVHKVEDPRTPRLYAIAEEAGLLGPHLTLLRQVAEAHRQVTGKALPINGAGVGGAALADLGFPASLVRGFALLARTAGIVGHLAEEMAQPIGMSLYREVEDRAVYVTDPPPSPTPDPH
jgi:citrate synthase